AVLPVGAKRSALGPRDGGASTVMECLARLRYARRRAPCLCSGQGTAAGRGEQPGETLAFTRGAHRMRRSAAPAAPCAAASLVALPAARTAPVCRAGRLGRRRRPV